MSFDQAMSFLTLTTPDPNRCKFYWVCQCHSIEKFAKWQIFLELADIGNLPNAKIEACFQVTRSEKVIGAASCKGLRDRKKKMYAESFLLPGETNWQAQILIW